MHWMDVFTELEVSSPFSITHGTLKRKPLQMLHFDVNLKNVTHIHYVIKLSWQQRNETDYTPTATVVKFQKNCMHEHFVYRLEMANIIITNILPRRETSCPFYNNDSFFINHLLAKVLGRSKICKFVPYSTLGNLYQLYTINQIR